MRKFVLAVALACAALTAAAQAQAPEEYLKDVESRFKQEMLPQALRPPLTVEQADAFGKTIKYFREASKTELPKIKAIDAKDDRRLKSDKERLEYWVGKEVPRLLEETLKQTRYTLDAEIRNKTDYVKFAADIDLNDKDKVRNNLANPDNVADRQEAIKNTRRCLDVMIAIDEALGEKSDWPDKRKQFDELARKFNEKLAAAAAMIMPPKDIGDAKLKEIAEATLKTPDSGVKEWKRLIVNSAKQQKQFSVYELRGNTVVRCDYDFEHFQATTIEAEGNDLFLYHNTLAFYKSGAPTTPLNKWVIRERFRGAKIAAENVGK